MQDDALRERFRGCLVGLAVGDALGAAAEFMREDDVRATYGRLDNFVTRRWMWKAGQYTDDTAMALCIARSIVERKSVDLDDISDRFVKWMVTDGRGIGNQTAAVLTGVRCGMEPFAASAQVWEQSGRQAAGNGGVMRCAPVALFDWDKPEALVSHSREVCRLTHADPRCEWSCVATNIAIAGLLIGARSVLDAVTSSIAGQCSQLEAALADAQETPISNMRLDGWDQGYTILTTQVAFAALVSGRPFEQALIEVVNKGGDADTNGAVAGALLGARDGYESISARWRDGLLEHDAIVGCADSLWAIAVHRC